ncbi:MAG: nitrile hydratase subunit beta [Myxococcota bacterium]
MNGIHDLGGMHGFGSVEREADEPLFHAPWEGRVFALLGLLLARGVTNVDAFRHGIERLDPATYLTAGYYGRWLASMETLCDEAGVVRRSELRARMQALSEGSRLAPARPLDLPPAAAAGDGYRRPLEEAPRFGAGDRVRARNLNPPGHTRLPRYVRSRSGCVSKLHGGFVFPDSHAHGGGEQPQHLYTVRFETRELWGTEAEPGFVHLDLFESYLEPV